MTNPLQRLMDEHRILSDSLRVTSRILRKDIRDAITPKHVFHYEEKDAALDRIKGAQGELNDLIVLGLVATFERTVRDHVKRRPTRMLKGDDPIDVAIHAQILKDVEYWRTSDRLIGVFAGLVDSVLLGQVKQIIGFRNWVAHGRATENPPDGNVLPELAFESPSLFLKMAGITDS